MSNGNKEMTVADGSDHAAPVIKAETHVFNDQGLFSCKNCGDSGDAQGMFNLPCNPRKTSRAQLLELIRCERCATEIAKRNQRQIGEQGCGIYYLRVTIPLLRSESEIAAEQSKPKKPSVQELQEQRDLETLEWVIESKRKREEAARAGRMQREREGRLDQVRQYATSFAEDIFDETAKLQPPKVRRWEDVFDSSDEAIASPPEEREIALFCGLPVHLPCCGRREPADRFLVFRGEVIGICAEASRIFLDVHNAMKDDGRYRKLLWFRDRNQAEESAAKWSKMAEEAGKKKR